MFFRSRRTCISAAHRPGFGVSVDTQAKERVAQEQFEGAKNVGGQGTGHGGEHHKVPIVQQGSAVLEAEPSLDKDHVGHAFLDDLDDHGDKEAHEKDADLVDVVVDRVSDAVELDQHRDQGADQAHFDHEVQRAREPEPDADAQEPDRVVQVDVVALFALEQAVVAAS